ncbi:endonuclease/exonuclease/phosphatase family protein [Pontibacter akesuensis]|uniref:Metal-dependent hydrolase, endonuclease/exonuclease/phosphatase family n=1 Tax=Pontibacter akesuensis TaxID=388950 RepID=A0A1I7K9K7_9BACT|nr:endonuclease/exonuclease/phosphatase family protein [Pontibacter akesuensis]GHA73955.1 endonuclease [Pontibacter akesuensis]SFU94111.1 Metal-dependent hydrolase, endonuclease/exonuclease/phosphatase family [Pontibacter akesuensis]
MSGTFKKIRRRVWLIINIVVVLWLLAGVYSLQVPPSEFWPAGFVAFSMPVPLVLNFFFLIYWALRRSWLVVLPFAVLILGWSYYARLIAINFEQEVPKGAKTLQVLSFNTHVFNAYDKISEGVPQVSDDMIEWVATHPADVFCLQEFYSRVNSIEHNNFNKIGTRYNKYKFASTDETDRIKANLGIVIFSKYPIVKGGTIHFSNTPVRTANRVAWADIDVEGDTVRIFAVHLQSMSIKAEDIENTYSAIGDEASFKKEGRNLARRLKRGFVARATQVQMLLDHVRASPYPVIVCGDFNDIPFSYTYNELAEELDNAFVEAGSGLGSTYNGILPFLRIDNQFYSEGLEAYNFETHYEMDLSDHFPVSATYVLKPKAREER